MIEQRSVGVEILDITHIDDMQWTERESMVGAGAGKSSSASDWNSMSLRASIGGSISSLNPLVSSKRGSADGFNYVFTIQVWITAEQQNYIISRSYKSFTILQTQLKKKYPRSNLPLLPKGGEITTNKKTALNEYMLALMSVPEVRPSIVCLFIYALPIICRIRSLLFLICCVFIRILPS